MLGRILLRCVLLAFVLALPLRFSSRVISRLLASGCHDADLTMRWLKHAGGSVLPPEAAQTIRTERPPARLRRDAPAGFQDVAGAGQLVGSGRENPFWDRGGQDPRGGRARRRSTTRAQASAYWARSRKPAPPDERAMGSSRRARLMLASEIGRGTCRGRMRH